MYCEYPRFIVARTFNTRSLCIAALWVHTRHNRCHVDHLNDNFVLSRDEWSICPDQAVELRLGGIHFTCNFLTLRGKNLSRSEKKKYYIIQKHSSITWALYETPSSRSSPVWMVKESSRPCTPPTTPLPSVKQPDDISVELQRCTSRNRQVKSRRTKSKDRATA